MAVYAGSSASGVVGALALQFVAPHFLPLIGAGLILIGFFVDEYARRRGTAPRPPQTRFIFGK